MGMEMPAPFGCEQDDYSWWDAGISGVTLRFRWQLKEQMRTAGPSATLRSGRDDNYQYQKQRRQQPQRPSLCSG
jgi:hypothetical protein